MKKSLSVFLTCAVSIFLFSCEDFLNGSSLKGELESQIEYATDAAEKLYIEAEPGSGDLLGDSGLRTIKRTDKLKLNFNASDNYVFIKWQVVDRLTRKPVSQSDFIKIKNADHLEAEAEVLKIKENLMIIPQVVKRPSVVSISPSNSNIEYFANTEVSLTFDDDMSGFPMTSAIEIKDATGKVYNQYFYEPSLSADGTKLSFIPKGSELSRIISQNADKKVRFYFTYSETFYKTVEGKEVFPIENSANNSIIFNSDLEKTPPVIENFVVTKSDPAVRPDTKPLRIKVYDKFDLHDHSSEGDVCTNHTGKRIFINLSAYDADSGIESVTIYETLEYRKNKTKIERNPYFTDGNFSFDYETKYNLQDLTVDSIGRVNFKDFYELKTDEDGAVLIQLVIRDYGGNVTVKEWSVILETGNTRQFKIKNEVFYDNLYVDYISVYKNESFSQNKYFEFYNKQIRKFILEKKITQTSSTWEDYPGYDGDYYFYDSESSNGFYDKKDTLKYQYSYINDSGEKIIKELEYRKIKIEPMNAECVDDDTIYYSSSFEKMHFAFEIENVSDLSGFNFKIITSLDEIFTKEHDFYYPEYANLIGIGSGSELMFDSGDYLKACVVITDDFIGVNSIDYNSPPGVIRALNEGFYQAYGHSFSMLSLKNPVYYPIGIFIDSDSNWADGNSIAGPISPDVSTKNTLNLVSAESNNFLDIKDIQLIKGERNSETVKLRVSINPECWNNWDEIYIDYSNDELSLNKTNTPVEKDSDFIDLIFKYYSLENSNLNLSLTGKRDNLYSKGPVKTVTKLSSLSLQDASAFDTFAPSISVPENFMNEYYGDYILVRADDKKELISDTKRVCGNIKGLPEVEFEKVIISGIEYYLYPVFNVSSGIKTFICTAFDNQENYNIQIRDFYFMNLTDTKTSKVINTSFQLDVQENQIIELFKNFPNSSPTKSNVLFNSLFWKDGGWISQYKGRTSDGYDDEAGYYKRSFQATSDNLRNTYVKVNCFVSYSNFTSINAYSSWQYLYTGEPSTIQKMISFDEGLFIQSDQPVLVRTIVTSEAFETAKDWDYEEWNARHRSVNEEKLDFSPENKGLQIYNYNLSEIPEGSTYVAAVHFADGTVKMGPVLRKK